METNNKLREALKDIGRLVEQIHFLYSDYPSEIHEIARKVNAALAAPPRNCDAMDWRTAWKIWREKFHPETPVGYSAVVKGTEAFMDWFTAPAAETEGGAK